MDRKVKYSFDSKVYPSSSAINQDCTFASFPNKRHSQPSVYPLSSLTRWKTNQSICLLLLYICLQRGGGVWMDGEMHWLHLFFLFSLRIPITLTTKINWRIEMHDMIVWSSVVFIGPATPKDCVDLTLLEIQPGAYFCEYKVTLNQLKIIEFPGFTHPW